MKLTSKILTSLAALCVFCAAPLYAQVDPGVQFTTSFPFYAGDQQLPAGSYLITQPDPSASILLISGPKSASVGFVPTETFKPTLDGKVFFNEYGNRDFLSKLTVTGDSDGEEFLPSRKERHAADAEHQQVSNRVITTRSSSGM